MMAAMPLHTYGHAMKVARECSQDEYLAVMRMTLNALLREESPLETEAGLHNSVLLIVCLGLLILEETGA
jgi:hypothetical protein